MVLLYGCLTFSGAFDGIFVTSSTSQQMCVYGCTSAGFTWRFVVMTGALHPTAVGGAKEQNKMISRFFKETVKSEFSGATSGGIFR